LKFIVRIEKCKLLKFAATQQYFLIFVINSLPNTGFYLRGIIYWIINRNHSVQYRILIQCTLTNHAWGFTINNCSEVDIYRSLTKTSPTSIHPFKYEWRQRNIPHNLQLKKFTIKYSLLYKHLKPGKVNIRTMQSSKEIAEFLMKPLQHTYLNISERTYWNDDISTASANPFVLKSLVWLQSLRPKSWTSSFFPLAVEIDVESIKNTN
jgi:hypothetical protein